MSESVGVGGAWKTKLGEWIGVGGAWKPFAGEWVGVGGAWKPYKSAGFSVSLSQTSVYNLGASSPVTSPAVVATPAGGVAPFTYLWSRVGGSASVIATAPTAASTTFQAPGIPGAPQVATFQVKVTDAGGATATALVSVELAFFSLPGGL